MADEGTGELSSKQWLTEIQNDSILSIIRLWILERKILSDYEKSEISGRKELLYKLMEHFYVHEGIVIFRHPLVNNEYIDRPIVPIGLYNPVFALAHSGFGAGHRGINETVKKINEI